jgi:hypothetical protein
MPYTNSNRFVEVYINDKYEGMYQITEQIEQDENRVAIDKQSGVLLNLDLDDGPELSPDPDDNFYSLVYQLPVCVKHPENITAAQINAIKADFAEIEHFIENKDYDALAKRMDIASLIDFLIIQELTRNVELVSPRSMYMYMSADRIYHFGPVWDFDGGFSFNWASMTNGHVYFGSQSWLMGGSNPSNHPRDAYNYISGFFVDMFGNQKFLAEYKARWAELNPGMLDYCFKQLDIYAAQCNDAMANNIKRWPIDKNYTQQIKEMKTWLTERASFYTDDLKSFK